MPWLFAPLLYDCADYAWSNFLLMKIHFKVKVPALVKELKLKSGIIVKYACCGSEIKSRFEQVVKIS